MKDRELEIKLQLDEAQFERILKLAQDTKDVEHEKLIDLYYCPNDYDYREYMKKKCLRIRKKNQKCLLDYKEIIDSREMYVQELVEYSTEISDLKQMSSILIVLGFDLVIEVKKERYEFTYDKIFRICLDKVDDLGNFIEIEIIDCDFSYEESGTLLKMIVNKLELSNNKINREGYSNMMYKLKHGESL